jgi:hypothetical protein
MSGAQKRASPCRNACNRGELLEGISPAICHCWAYRIENLIIHCDMSPQPWIDMDWLAFPIKTRGKSDARQIGSGTRSRTLGMPIGPQIQQFFLLNQPLVFSPSCIRARRTLCALANTKRAIAIGRVGGLGSDLLSACRSLMRSNDVVAPYVLIHQCNFLVLLTAILAASH